MILRPGTTPAETPLITIAAGVAVAEVLGLRLSWPNDVVTPDFYKVAGLLAELELRGGRVLWVVLGVGLNVNQPGFPVELPRARSLRQLGGRDLDRFALLDRLLPALDHRVAQVVDRRDELVQAWTDLAETTGRQVRVGDLQGTAVGLRADGALLLRCADGLVHPVVAGDVQREEA